LYRVSSTDYDVSRCFANRFAACMRMRKLGHGQSVLFCIPKEIEHKILSLKGQSLLDDGLCIADVLRWVMTGTCQELRRTVPLWITQGLRFYRHQAVWDSQQPNKREHKAWASRFLEEEAQSIADRYSPSNTDLDLNALVTDADALTIFRQRCQDFGVREMQAATLEEEEERELAPEAERERQVERPRDIRPCRHRLDTDVVRLVETGAFSATSKSFTPAFQALNEATWNFLSSLELNKSFPHLYVTSDFLYTVWVANPMDQQDCFQRSVQWVLSAARSRLVIISPYEAQHLLPRIAGSPHVALHLYAPRTSFEFPAPGLQLYTITGREAVSPVSSRAMAELNLFAGQLYLSSFDEYKTICDMLGLAWKTVSSYETVEADGFIPPDLSDYENRSSFTQSPVAFFKELMANVRQNCESVDKTHMGKILAGVLMTEEEFGG
jgi:hypothetical protein